MTLCAIYDTIHQAKNAASYACYDLYLYQVGTLARTNNVVVFLFLLRKYVLVSGM